MTSILVILIVIVAILLVISVLVQNPKGGGVASGWGINTNQFGVRKTTDFLEKSTWVLVGMLLILSISVNSLYTEGDDTETPTSINVEKAQENKAQMPAAPAPGATAPAAQPAEAPEAQ